MENFTKNFWNVVKFIFSRLNCLLLSRVLVVVTVLGLCGVAEADILYWSKTAEDNNWNNINNWNSDALGTPATRAPAIYDDAVIQEQDTGYSNYPDMSFGLGDSSDYFQKLTIDTGATLLVNGPLYANQITNNGNLNVISPIYTNLDFTNNGNLTVANSSPITLNGLGYFYNYGTATIGIGSIITAYSLINSGTLNTRSNIELNTTYGSFLNNSGATFINDYHVQAATAVNNGTWQGTGAGFTLYGSGDAYSGTGDIIVPGAITWIEAVNGNIKVDGNISGTSLIQFRAPNGNVIVNGDFGSYDDDYLNIEYKTSPSGTFELNGAVAIDGITTTGGATPTVQYNGTITRYTVSSGQTYTVSSDFEFEEIIVRDGGTLVLNANVTVKNSGAGIQNAGTVRITNNVIIDSDLKNTASTGKIELTSSAKFIKNVDLSQGTFSSSDTTYFYNPTNSPAIVWKAKDGFNFEKFWTWGNTEIQLQGDATARDFRVFTNDTDAPYVNYSFTSKVTGTGTLTISDNIEINRASSTDGVIGTFEIDCNVNTKDIRTHSGNVLQVNAGKKLTINGNLYHWANNGIPKTQYNIDGTLDMVKSDGIIQLAQIDGAAELNVGSTGVINTPKIISNNATYSNEGSTTAVTIANGGRIECNEFVIPQNWPAVVNNGTIQADSKISAKSFTGTGTLKIYDGAPAVIQAFEASSQGKIEIDSSSSVTIGNGTNKNVWTVDEFDASRSMGGRTITLNNCEIITTDLQLKGTSDTSLLTLNTTSADGSGFVLSSDITSGLEYLAVGPNILIKDASGDTASGEHYVEASDSEATDPSADDDLLAIYKNGWHIRPLKYFTFKWQGGTSTDWATASNWNTGIVPQEECNVIVPDASVTVTNWPVVPNSAVSIGSLKVESGGEITIGSNNLTVTNDTAVDPILADPFVNFGTLIYTNAGRIVDGASDELSDITNGGTVEFKGDASYSGTIAHITYPDVKITSGSWEAGADSSTGINCSNAYLNGGTIKGFVGVSSDTGKIQIIENSLADGDVIFNADNFIIDSGKTFNASGKKFTLYPYSSSKTITLGGSETGSLEITDDEISSISADTIILGDDTNTSSIKIKGNFTASENISLITAGSITKEGTSVIDVGTKKLALEANSIGSSTAYIDFNAASIKATSNDEDIYLAQDGTFATLEEDDINAGSGNVYLKGLVFSLASDSVGGTGEVLLTSYGASDVMSVNQTLINGIKGRDKLILGDDSRTAKISFSGAIALDKFNNGVDIVASNIESSSCSVSSGLVNLIPYGTPLEMSLTDTFTFYDLAIKNLANEATITGDNLTVSNDFTIEKSSVVFTGNNWQVKNFIASTDMGGKSVKLNGCEISVEALELKGQSDSARLTIGGAAGSGFVVDEIKDAGEYLDIDENILVKDNFSDTETGEYYCRATDSACLVGSQDEKNAYDLKRIRNGWRIRPLKEFTFVWEGGTSTEWNNKRNWQIRVAPEQECNVEIPDSVASGNWPVVPNTDVSIGSLKIGSSSTTDANIKIGSNNLTVTNVISSPPDPSDPPNPFVNFGTLIYTNAGKIVDGATPSNEINDASNGGTTRFDGGSYSGLITNVSYANVEVVSGTWQAGEDSSTGVACSNLDFKGGTVKGYFEVTDTTGKVQVLDETAANGKLICVAPEIDVIATTGKLNCQKELNFEADKITVRGTLTLSEDFDFKCDELVVDNSASINASGKKGTIYTRDNTRSIVLGVVDTSALSLLADEIALITADSITIGDDTNTANIQIKDDFSVDKSFTLITSGALEQDSGKSIEVTSGDLYFNAAQGIGTLSDPVTINKGYTNLKTEVSDTDAVTSLKFSDTAAIAIDSTYDFILSGDLKIETSGPLEIARDLTNDKGSIELISAKDISRSAGVVTSSITSGIISLVANDGDIGAAASYIQIECDSVKANASNGDIYISQDGTIKVLTADDILAGTKNVYLQAGAFDFAADSVGGTGDVTLLAYTPATTELPIDSSVIDGVAGDPNRTLKLGVEDSDPSHIDEITFTGAMDLSRFNVVEVYARRIKSDGCDITGGEINLFPDITSISGSNEKREITVLGEFKFYDLIITDFDDATVKFEAGKTQTIRNKLDLKGTTADFELKLRSTVFDTQWRIVCEKEDSVDIELVDVQDSYNDSTFILTAVNSKDKGNLDRWAMQKQEYKWTGLAKESDPTADPTDWFNRKNWYPRSVPQMDSFVIISDEVTIEDPATRTITVADFPVFTADVDLRRGKIDIEQNAQLDLKTYNLKTVGVLNNKGRLRLSGENEIEYYSPRNDAEWLGEDRFKQGDGSTIEYYGTIVEQGSTNKHLALGNDYKNLEFTNGANTPSSITVDLKIEETLKITNGLSNAIELTGNNQYKGEVTIGDSTTSAGSIILNGDSNGMTLVSDAVANSLEIGCDVNLSNVTTVETQTYKGDVTLTADTTFKCSGSSTSEIVFEKQLLGSGTDNFDYGFTVDNFDATYKGDVTCKSIIGLNSTFDGGNTQKVLTKETQSYTGNIESTSSLAITSEDEFIKFEGSLISASGYKISAPNGVRVLGGTASANWTWTGGTGKIDLGDSELFVDTKSIIALDTNLDAKNIYMFNGTVNLNSGVALNAKDNIAVFGTNYSADDPGYNGNNTRFAYWGYDDLIYKPTVASYSTVLGVNGATLKVDSDDDKIGNLYINGTNLTGCTLSIVDNAISNPVFNFTNDVTEKQWGLPYSVVFNSTISNVTATGGHLAAASGDSRQKCVDGGGNNDHVQFIVPQIVEAYSVYDDVIYVEFNIPVENSNGEIQTNVALYSNNDLAKGGIWYNGTSYNFSGAYEDADCTIPLSDTSGSDISGFYLKAIETWNTDATGKLVASNITLNAEDFSTDRSGNKKNVKTDFSFFEGLFTAANGHTLSRSYGINSEDKYDDTGDKASPVLIAAYTGQELHKVGDATVQKYEDAHNFIEFRYSEPIDVTVGGTLLSYDGGQSNVAVSMPNSSSGITIDGFATIANGSIHAGTKNTSSVASPHALYRNFTVNSGEGDKNQAYRLRLSVAGIVDGTVSYGGKNYHNYVGYIDTATTPTGIITRSANLPNSVITDIEGNEVDNAQGVTNHVLPQISINEYEFNNIKDVEKQTSLYGQWDVLPPVIAPFVTGKNSQGDISEGILWDTWSQTGTSTGYEIIGSTTGIYLEDIELHLFDNNKDQARKWSNKWWRTRRGWFEGSNANATWGLPDTKGGSRPYELDNNFTTDNITMGGIRRSSLVGANAAFTYKTVTDIGDSEEKNINTQDIGQVVRHPILRSTTDPVTEQDGLYLSFKLNDSDTYVPVRTRFKVYYDPSKGDYVTDLAGNRLKTSYQTKTEFSSPDLTPPNYIMTLSPVAHNKIYVMFTKNLADPTGKLLADMSDAEREPILEKIKESFIICREDDTAPASGLAIEKVEFIKATREFTALLFTIERNVTLDDVKNMWLRAHGTNDMIVDISTGLSMRDTNIRDLLGNCLPEDKAHCLSDFAINAANVLYGYAHEKDDDGWDEQGIYGNISPISSDYAVHDFSASQGNFGRFVSDRDVTLQVQLISGVDSSGNYLSTSENFILISSMKKSLIPTMVSDLINQTTKNKWRLWLPSVLTTLATTPNTNILTSPPIVSAGDADGLLWNYTFANDDYNFKAGDEVQFIFKIDGVTIDHDGDNLTPRVPLYAVSMPENRIKADDLSFIDLWSFGFKDVKKQRSGVSIRNNVINVGVKEQVVLEIDMKEAGNLDIYVMTAEGNVIKQLSKGQVSKGTHYYKWDGTNNKGKTVARGIYFVRVVGKNIDETRKVMCIK